MKDKLVSPDDLRFLHPALEGKKGDKLIRWGMKMSGIDIANEVYDRSKHLSGADFCADLLDKMGVKRNVKNVEVLEKYKDKPFITISNHPYGHIDGISVIETMDSKVGNYKMMVNVILGLIDTMSENFITVDPHKTEHLRTVTMGGLKECIAHIRSGYPLGFFPAGAVSNLYFRKGKFVIRDREWQSSVMKIIQKARVPVIPMHISGHNSIRFYIARIFGWKARNMLLCRELKNKKGKEIVITIGEPILPETLKKFDNAEQLAKFLYAKTYNLAKKK